MAICAFLSLAVSVAWPNDAAAEDHRDFAVSLLGLPVVRVSFVASPSEVEDGLLRSSGLEIGAPFSSGMIRRAVKLLYRLDRFENAYASVEREGVGVHVELVLPPRPRVLAIEVQSRGVLSEAEIEELLGLGVGRSIEHQALADGRRALTDALRRRGYRGAAVGLATQRLNDEGGSKLIVRLDEGPVTVVRRVTFEGSIAVGRWRLEEQLGLGAGDVLDLARLEASLGGLRQFYVELGYLDAKIGSPEVRDLRESAQGRPLADVVVHVDSGPEVSIRFKGNRQIPTRLLVGDASTLAESGTGLSGLVEAKERMLARYSLRGYWKARVEPAVRVSKDGQRKEILFSVLEGMRGRVASMAFPGNTVFTEQELEECVEDSLAASLGAELERPGVDPEVVATGLGDRSSTEPRDSPQPSNAPPDPERVWPFARRKTRVYVDRAYRTAADAVADLYRSRGFQSARVKRPHVSERSGGRLLDVSFEIEEGVEWQVGALAFTGHENLSGDELLRLCKVDPAREGGEPLSFFAVEEARRLIIARYRELGFLYATVSVRLRDVPVRGQIDGASFADLASSKRFMPDSLCQAATRDRSPACPVQLVFAISEGPEVRVGKLVVRGSERTHETLVRDEVTVSEGDVLRETDMTASRANLLRLGVFDRVSVRPLEEEEIATRKDVLAMVRERRPFSFEVGAGASTEEGLRLFAGFGHANLLGRAIRFQANGKVNFQPNAFLVVYNETIRDAIERFYDEFSALQRIERETSVGFSFPRITGLPRGFSAGVDLSVLRKIEPTFVEDARIMTLTGHYKGLRPELLGKPRPLTLQLRADLDWSDVRCNEALTSTPTLGRTAELCSADRPRTGSSIYVTAGPRLSFDLRDDPLDPRSGLYAELETTFAKGLDPGSPDHVKLEGQLNGYLPLGRGGAVLAVALIAKRIFPFGSEEIPINRRYFAGGRSTVRGYPEQSLFPQDVPRGANGLPSALVSPGGELLVALKSEVRLPLYQAISVAGFFDVGDLFLSAKSFVINRDTPMGAGGGLRVATPVGPIAVDFGVPVNRRGDPGEQALTLHFAVRSF